MTTQDLAKREKQELKAEEGTRPGRWFVQDVDILEDDDALWLWADMPGVDPDQVHVDVHDEVLTIEGRVSTKDYEGLAPVYTEYNVGNWVRRFTMPPGSFDDAKIAARLVNGVLEVKLPKSERAKPRRIPVSVS